MTQPDPGIEARARIEGDIRIAIWNAGMGGGMGQDLTQALTSRVMAEPTMLRALAAVSTPSPPSGWKLVPVKASRSMCISAAERAGIPLTPKGAAEFWAAMLSAAPAVPGVE